MKNLYLLSTDKPSRLIGSRLNLSLKNIPIPSFEAFKTYNIYITSDEEIKEGDYVVQINFEKTNTQVIKCETEFQTKIANSKDGSFSKNKIILTTDADLINDGVQEINDGFLEWFVKNPNCEWVVIEKKMLCDYCGEENCDNLRCRGYADSVWYEIIIPMIQDKEEIKQETLEEYINEVTKKFKDEMSIKFISGGIKLGVKWQQEQDKKLYSEEEVYTLLNNALWDLSEMGYNQKKLDEWFEQFKKK